MHWSAEELILVVTGTLFLSIVASSFLPRVELTPRSRAAFAIGAAAFLGAAVILARIEAVRYPLPLWLVPVIPLAVIAVLVRDAWRRSPAPMPEQEDTSARSVTRVSTRATHAGAHSPQSPRSEQVLRNRAENPAASPQELASIAYSHPTLRVAVAGNPSAPANLLEWLASVGDPAVHAAISARPRVAV